jgi:threonine/homoserine/homoserine lactone efflux protein
MIPAIFIKGIIIGILVSAPLGPIGIMCIQRTLNRGYMVGFISGLGAASADIIFAVIAGFGFSIIINFIEEKHIYFQILGGIFVLYIGYRIFNTNPVKQLRLQRLNKTRLTQDFGSIFLLTISNPMSIFLFLAIMAALNVANELLSFFELSILIAGISGGAVLWWFVLASIANRFRNKIRLRSIWWLNKITGSVVFLIGLVVILSVWIVK